MIEKIKLLYKYFKTIFSSFGCFKCEKKSYKYDIYLKKN